MQPEAAKYLFDVQHAAALISRFCEGKTFDQYRADDLLKSGVERQFMIIGEALSQLAKVAPDVTERIAAFRQIVAFRNILVHGYATVDDKIVWGVVETSLPSLRESVDMLLGKA